MQSKLTLIGMYNYDPTLFDGFNVPDGIDKETSINQILIRSGEFELLYTDIDFMKELISFFCKKHKRTFTKWINALDIVYDPLNNYDRKEEYIDSRTGNKAETHTNSNSKTDDSVSTSASDSSTTGSSSPAQMTDTATTSVSAFDASGFQNKEQTVTGHVLNTAASDSSSISSTGSTTNTNSINETNTGNVDQTENEIIKHEAHLYGNIGVQMSQSMLQAELDVQRFNIYENIADLFIDEFCIMVY